MYSPARMKRPLQSILSTELFDIPTFPALLSDTKGRLNMTDTRTVDSIRLLNVDAKGASEVFGAQWDRQRYFYPTVENVHVVRDVTDPRVENEVGSVVMCDNLAHPMNGTFFYRITEHATGASIVYATDTEAYRGGNQALIKFARGADILVHDAQYTPEQYASDGFIVQGFGHSDYLAAVEVAAAAEVKTLLLTHYDPRNGDQVVKEMEQDAKRYARKLSKQLEVVAAREGESLTCYAYSLTALESGR